MCKLPQDSDAAEACGRQGKRHLKARRTGLKKGKYSLPPPPTKRLYAPLAEDTNPESTTRNDLWVILNGTYMRMNDCDEEKCVIEALIMCYLRLSFNMNALSVIFYIRIFRLTSVLVSWKWKRINAIFTSKCGKNRFSLTPSPSTWYLMLQQLHL